MHDHHDRGAAPSPADIAYYLGPASPDLRAHAVADHAHEESWKSMALLALIFSSLALLVSIVSVVLLAS